ncbi:hypothetical protein BDV27DRAFT_132678 [Aspergillus caelatus]|uniref:Uncharacterized protein n=1 Tax=Aspergillus caelatus TaxID=61420 RepID=A0A5N6ZWD7_9EURO|nr:uncharacterized protein BDV27DRAFT_132678 [Aspergillus caelatus]KAE8361678.1 hypothetical protein BDV27DRAFT_132678 [Aspergillus caelatus]
MNLLSTILALVVVSMATAVTAANLDNNIEARGCATIGMSCKKNRDCCASYSCKNTVAKNLSVCQ